MDTHQQHQHIANKLQLYAHKQAVQTNATCTGPFQALMDYPTCDVSKCVRQHFHVNVHYINEICASFGQRLCTARKPDRF